MTTTISVLKTDDASKAALATIFDPVNEISCAAYGGGGHCNPTRVTAKINFWGKRGDDAANSQDSCALAKIVYVDSEPAAMFNIGFSGNTPTVLDKTTATPHLVYEFSGIFIRDAFINNTEVSVAVKSAIANCKAGEQYSKVFTSFSIAHPYQKEFLVKSGAIELTTENIESLLGSNSLSPGKFKLEDQKIMECTKWDKASPRIQHDNGWSDSEQCEVWVEKSFFIFNIHDQAIEVSGAEL